MFEIGKPRPKDIEVGAAHNLWVLGCSPYSDLVGLCFTAYMTMSHNMQATFVERLHSETLYFHLPIGEITITLHEVSCLLHLPIRGNY